jgi:protoporphyrinogen oxidase
MISKSYECCIIGAGAAGLGAAVELANNGVTNIVILDRNRLVGGLARTERFDGFRFDLGPHRFFTKSKEIRRLWNDTLGKDFIAVDRLTRIYYKGMYFHYPIKAFDALGKLGPFQATHALLSFFHATLKGRDHAVTFEDWVTRRFGRKLYEMFFKTYTEKVWGIPCSKIGAEWAAQRIKGLDILEVIKDAVFGDGQGRVKTLVEQFDYPVYGAGQMYEAMTDYVVKRGVDVKLETRVNRFNRTDNKITSIEFVGPHGEKGAISAGGYLNSAPLTEFFKAICPSLGRDVLKASEELYFRGHITVNLVVDGENFFPDQWIYVHSPEEKMARLVNYNNFSRAMVNHKRKTAVSVEYFVFQNDDLWKMSDNDLKELAIEELDHTGLIPKKRVENAWVIRELESYPTYYLGFQRPYDLLKRRVDEFTNLYPIGRGGLYKYNNQDHSSMTGILAARNFLKTPDSPYNLWNVNIDAEYLESGKREAD